MHERIHKLASSANEAAYDAAATRDYVDGAPHVKHPDLRRLYASLVVQVYDYGARYASPPRVLDLGAGEGSATLPFLQLGARVTAVDISPSQLAALRSRCAAFGERLELRCSDITDAIRNTESYDVIVASSFLHHVPDYLGLIRDAIPHLTPHGQFFSFQDPLRYDALGKLQKTFSDVAYFSWRMTKGDVWGGLQRRLRRRRGVYLADSVHDNAEYHVTRNGVDQEAICAILEAAGFRCDLVRYFSTQSRFFQPLGTVLGMRNTFALIAQRHT